MKSTFFTLAITASVLLVACSEAPKTTNNNSTAEAPKAEPPFVKEGELDIIAADGKPIKHLSIEKALTESERAQGLMYRSSMADSCGMLFVMDNEEEQNFYMKNTIMPLDIMYIDSKKKIVTIARYTKPYSLDNILSGKPALYVLEVNAGFSDKYGVKEGDKVQF